MHVLEYAAKFLCHDALLVKLVDAALHGTHEHMEGERFTYADFQEHFLGAQIKKEDDATAAYTQKMCQKAVKVASKKLLQDFLDRLRCNKLKDCPETEEYVKLECEQTQRAHKLPCAGSGHELLVNHVFISFICAPSVGTEEKIPLKNPFCGYFILWISSFSFCGYLQAEEIHSVDIFRLISGDSSE